MIRLPAAVQDWFTLRRSIVVVAAVVGGCAWLLHRAYDGHASPFSALVVAPFAAALLAPALIGLVTGYVRWVDERVLLPWHGTHHAFDGHRIRVVERRDRLWFSSRDVHAALGVPRREAALRALRTTERRDDEELGELLSNDGLAAVFGRATDRTTLRLVRWADGDVRRPWQKRRDGAADPADPPDRPLAARAPD